MGRLRFALRASVFGVLLLIPAYAGAASLTLAWDPESSAAGFIVSYGTQSGIYTNSLDAGSATITQIDGLASGTMYYFIVRAYDSTGSLSAPSFEVSGMTSGAASAPPTIQCPAPVTSSADGNPVVVTFSPTISGGMAPVNASCSPASGSLFPVGTTPLTCTATDSLQLSSSCTSSVVVTYNPPTAAPLSVMCPAPSGTSYNGGPIPLTFSPTVSGGFAPVTSSCTPASGSLFPVGSTSLTCTAVDAKLTTATCTSTAVVTSAIAAPVPSTSPLDISCPLIAPVVSHSGNPVKVTFSPAVTGGVAPVTVSCIPASGSLFAVGSTGVSCTAVDARQQIDSCATSVIVTSDKTAAPTPIPTGNPIEFDAEISLLAGRCPADTFTAINTSLAPQTFVVTTTSLTNYAKGSCGTLANTRKVHVQGLTQADGSVIATAITFAK